MTKEGDITEVQFLNGEKVKVDRHTLAANLKIHQYAAHSQGLRLGQLIEFNGIELSPEKYAVITATLELDPKQYFF